MSRSDLKREQDEYNARIKAEQDRFAATKRHGTTRRTFLDHINDPAIIEIAEGLPHAENPHQEEE